MPAIWLAGLAFYLLALLRAVIVLSEYQARRRAYAIAIGALIAAPAIGAWMSAMGSNPIAVAVVLGGPVLVLLLAPWQILVVTRSLSPDRGLRYACGRLMALAQGEQLTPNTKAKLGRELKALDAWLTPGTSRLIELIRREFAALVDSTSQKDTDEARGRINSLMRDALDELSEES